MKKIIGIILIILGIFLGCYFGLWKMFIGGIFAIANAFDNGTLTATFIAYNLIKIILATPVGALISQILAGAGIVLIND